MATALIPEVIQPGVLYAPSNNNLFSILTNQLINTDDAMRMAGTPTSNFRAYQPAISGIHYPANVSDPISILYWIRPNVSTSGVLSVGIRNDMVLMMVSDFAYSAPSVNRSSGDSTTGWRWEIAARIAQTVQSAQTCGWYIATAGAGAAVLFNSSGVATGSYTSLAWRFAGNNAIPTVYDYALNNLSTSGTAGTVGTRGPLTSPYFGLGIVPQTTNWHSMNHNVDISKIAIFNRMVTDDELLALNDSMINGGPSP